MEAKEKTRIGHVVSHKMDQTVVVAVDTRKRHPLYKKTFKRTIKYKVHDKDNKAQVGDKVRIVVTRPLSREKRWRLAEIIEKSQLGEE